MPTYTIRMPEPGDRVQFHDEQDGVERVGELVMYAAALDIYLVRFGTEDRGMAETRSVRGRHVRTCGRAGQ